MRTALLICACLFVTLCSAQGEGLYFAQTFVNKTVRADREDVAATAKLINATTKDIKVTWIKEVSDLPRVWQNFVCDTNKCHLPKIDSAEFILKAGSSAPIIAHIYPQGVEGEGQVSIRVVNSENRSENAIATFTFSKAKPTVNVSKGPRLYPNPGAEEFSVVSAEPLSKVTLTNMLGKVVREYPAYLPQFDVRDLPNGIYLATIFAADGRVLKTLRYSKRQVMP